MKTIEQLANDEELCTYCDLQDVQASSYNPEGCGGSRCEEAYQNYIEQNNLENELVLEDLENEK